MKTCPNCHKEVLEDSIFCEHCGTRLTADLTAPIINGIPINSQKVRTYKIPFIIVLIALVITLVWGGVTYKNYLEWKEYAEMLERRH